MIRVLSSVPAHTLSHSIAMAVQPSSIRNTGAKAMEIGEVSPMR